MKSSSRARLQAATLQFPSPPPRRGGEGRVQFADSASLGMPMALSRVHSPRWLGGAQGDARESADAATQGQGCHAELRAYGSTRVVKRKAIASSLSQENLLPSPVHRRALRPGS